MVTTKFKPGMREEGIRIINEAPKQEARGFTGILALLHDDDPDSATIISFWDSEDSLNASGKGIFQDVMKATENVRIGTPEIRNAKLSEMRGQLVSVRA